MLSAGGRPTTSMSAPPARPCVTTNVRARPFESGIVMRNAAPSSSSSMGGRDASPCDEIVRRRSTGSPPAPTSLSRSSLIRGSFEMSKELESPERQPEVIVVACARGFLLKLVEE